MQLGPRPLRRATRRPRPGSARGGTRSSAPGTAPAAASAAVDQLAPGERIERLRASRTPCRPPALRPPRSRTRPRPPRPRRSPPRSAGGSRSSRAASSAWMVGGIATCPSASGASFSRATICSTNSGFPAARSTTWARSVFARRPRPSGSSSISAETAPAGSGSSVSVSARGPDDGQSGRRSSSSSRARQRISSGASRALQAEVLDQVEQRRLGPVDVLEDQDQRLAMRERLDPGAHRPRDVRPGGDALLECRRPAGPGRRGRPGGAPPPAAPRSPRAGPGRRRCGRSRPAARR